MASKTLSKYTLFVKDIKICDAIEIFGSLKNLKNKISLACRFSTKR